MIRAVTFVVAFVTFIGGVAAAFDVIQIGAASVESRGGVLRVAVAYDYSHRSHSEPWLLFDVGVTAGEGQWLTRDDFVLVMPDGRVVGTPTQSEWRRDISGALAILNRAQASRTNVVDSVFGCMVSYIREPTVTRGLRRNYCDRRSFWVQSGIADRYVAVNKHRAARFDVLFKAPAGAENWPAGEYEFHIRGKYETAHLPVVLR